MVPDADVCLIVEGGYPYILGGVGSWMDALMRASPSLKFHVITISIASQPRVRKYAIADNVVGITDMILDVAPKGRATKARDERHIQDGVRLMRTVLSGDSGRSFQALIELVRETGFGQAALLDSKPAWAAMEAVYQELLPDGPLIDFFWSWRFLARSLLAIISTPLPDARVFHAVSTGYAGMVGAYARHVTGRPYVVTEHGIYTNERRIELGVADWIFESGASGFTVGQKAAELRDVWMTAFTSFSRISYALADIITTQYRANQDYQRFDGAPEDKLRIIPNGIDVDLYAGVSRSTEPRRPTVLMIGRIVPIKDTRTFIMAMSLLKELVPECDCIPDRSGRGRSRLRRRLPGAGRSAWPRINGTISWPGAGREGVSGPLRRYSADEHQRSAADRLAGGSRDRAACGHDRCGLLPGDHRRVRG